MTEKTGTASVFSVTATVQTEVAPVFVILAEGRRLSAARASYGPIAVYAGRT